MDTNNAAGTAIVLQYSAVPTTATATGGITSTDRYPDLTSGTGQLIPQLEWNFGVNNQQPIVLRGTSDFLGIIVSAVGTTPLANIWIEWTEE